MTICAGRANCAGLISPDSPRRGAGLVNRPAKAASRAGASCTDSPVQMTPAEKLSTSKRQRGSKSQQRVRVWKCNLRELRTALNLTQRDVALAVGLSCAGYHHIETTGSDVCLTTCVKLSEFFGKPILEIWEKPQ